MSSDNNNNDNNNNTALGPSETYPSVSISVVSKYSRETVQDAPSLGTIWSYRKAILYCLITAFTGFIFGWDVGTIGGITNFDTYRQKFGQYVEGDWTMNSLIVGLIIAVFNAGCAIGGLTLSKIADKLGRKWCLYISLIIYNVGVLVQETSVFSGAWFQFMIGRIITGLSIGASSVVAPMFISESAPVSIRGSMVVLFQLMITFGILMGNVTNFGSKQTITGDNEWLIPIWLCHIWSLLILVGLIKMPESAIYYVSKAQYDRAAISLSTLNNVPADSVFVRSELGRMIDYQEEMESLQKKSSWHDVFDRENLQRLSVGVGVMIFQQFTGANYFFYYGTSLFASVGLSDSYVTAIILGAVNFVCTFLGIITIEKFGRRCTLLLGSFGMFICMFVYTCLGSFALSDARSGEFTAVGILMVVFTCCYICFFATTWGPGAFVVVSELYNVRTRAMAMAIATSCNWLCNFLISLFTPFIAADIGFKLGFVFSACLLASAGFVWFCVPETKGLRVEEVDAMFSKEDTVA